MLMCFAQFKKKKKKKFLCVPVSGEADLGEADGQEGDGGAMASSSSIR